MKIVPAANTAYIQMLVSCFARKKEEEIKNFVEIIFRYQGP
jgi:hypothetical protein